MSWGWTADAKDWTAEAVKVCPTRVEVDRPSAEISAELKATKRRIDESRKSLVAQRCVAAVIAYQQRTNQCTRSGASI